MIAVAFVPLTVAVVFYVAMWRVERKAHIENQRRHAEWVADTARAKRDGTVPPPPPNRVRVR